jgi:membrane protein DedA with SNARE-associated domain
MTPAEVESVYRVAAVVASAVAGVWIGCVAWSAWGRIVREWRFYKLRKEIGI